MLLENRGIALCKLFHLRLQKLKLKRYKYSLSGGTKKIMLEHTFDYKIHMLTVVVFEHEFTMDGGMKNIQCM